MGVRRRSFFLLCGGRPITHERLQYGMAFIKVLMGVRIFFYAVLLEHSFIADSWRIFAGFAQIQLRLALLDISIRSHGQEGGERHQAQGSAGDPP